LRAEHCSDSAGDTVRWRINSRHGVLPGVCIRATVSTGFRAPSLAQALVGGGGRADRAGWIADPPRGHHAIFRTRDVQHG
jgi:outer membrane receptor for ferrienterochelin and colicin